MPYAGKSFVTAVLLCLCAAQAAAEPAVTERRSNLRSGPGPAFTTIALLPAGTKLNTEKCTDEWCRVKLGRQIGYVSRGLLKIGMDSFASAVPQAATPQPAPADVKPTLSGAKVWQWRDSEWRNDHWRRLEWHNRLSGR